jgi:hypothetical protein
MVFIVSLDIRLNLFTFSLHSLSAGVDLSCIPQI